MASFAGWSASADGSAAMLSSSWSSTSTVSATVTLYSEWLREALLARAAQTIAPDPSAILADLAAEVEVAPLAMAPPPIVDVRAQIRAEHARGGRDLARRAARAGRLGAAGAMRFVAGAR
jgi:hypothetical protein